MRSNDKLFREIAEKYTQQYGQSLRDELRELEQQPDALPSTDRLEMRVRSQIAATRRKPYLRSIAAVAACFALVILLPLAFRSEAPLPDSMSSSPPAHSDAAPSQNFSPIPLSAPLPVGFSEAGFEQDNGKSVYYIENIYMDNVVLTLEKAVLPDTSGLTAITLGDTVAYGTQTDSYSLLTFQSGEIVYEFTCRYDINTLLELSLAFL